MKKLMLGVVTAAAMIGPVAPTYAQSATPPEGCEAFLTVQFKGCLMSIYWRCPSAPEGTTWEASYDEDGPLSVSTFNKEFQWLDTYFFFDGSRERMRDTGPKPALLSELIATGKNEYEFSTFVSSEDGNQSITYTGVDTLTGETTMVDGEKLLITEFASVAVDADTGEQLHSTYGSQYVLEEENLFLLGTDTWTEDGVTAKSDYSPLDILRPGDKGFGRTKPLYECGAVTL
jgi:hypothetical protein